MTSNQPEADGEARDDDIDPDTEPDPGEIDNGEIDNGEIDNGEIDNGEIDNGEDDGVQEDDGEDDGDPEDLGDDEAPSEDLGEDDLYDDPDDEGPSRLMLVVGAAVAFVAIAIVGVLIASGGDSGGSGGNGNGNDNNAADERTDVGIFGTTDQFDRPDSATELGDFAPSRPWVVDEGAGTWGIINDEAALIEAGEFRNHAVIGLGQGDGGAQVRLDKVVNGAGLVFRYVGPYNYWAVVAVPDVATWNLIKVVDGDQEVVGNTGQSPTADGTTVGVRLRGDTIEVIINGRIRKTVVDDFQLDAGKVGLTARGPDSTDARFDDFVAGLPGGVPLSGGQGGGAPAGGTSIPGAGGATTTTAAP